LGAFRAAIEAGADILETDVHLTKDGQVVIAHDPDLSRLTGRAGLVAEHTAAELSQMDLGGGYGFLLLAEALEALPEQKFNVDLKVAQVANAFVDVITQLHAHDRVLIASFDEKQRRIASEKLPGVVTGASVPHVVEGRLRSWLGLSSDTWSIPPGMVALQLPITSFGLPLVTPSLIRMAHRKGLEVHVWTINDGDTMQRLWDLGVDGIMTDRADIAMDARESFLGHCSPHS
jgi:glycerophosphoryl diester phosphodiesterase